jgi:transcriptional antiterminator RfaH
VNRWYVAETQPRAEAKALFHLQRQGFEAYLPQYRKLRRHARRAEWVRAPLFPRYLFVQMDVARAAWRAIRSTVGVTRLVCRGEAPAPVPAGVVEDIRFREDGTGVVAMPPRFRPGEAVQIVSGAFADRVGLFQCATDEARVILLLDLLGRQTKVMLPIDAVAALG